MNPPQYWINKYPTTWRVYLTLPHGAAQVPGHYIRCTSLAELRVAVARMRSEGFTRRDRYVHPHIRDAAELKRLSDAVGQWDGRPRLDESVVRVLAELKRLPAFDDPDATEGCCQVTAAREVCRIILRSLNVDGLGGCRLCCS